MKDAQQKGWSFLFTPVQNLLWTVHPSVHVIDEIWSETNQNFHTFLDRPRGGVQMTPTHS